MSLEDFFARIARLSAMHTHYDKLNAGYGRKMNLELTKVVLGQYSYLNHDHHISSIFKIAEKYTAEIWDWYNYAYSNNCSNTLVQNNPIPQPTSLEAAKVQLNQKKQRFPENYQPTFEKKFWERFERKKRHEHFKFSVYNKMKLSFTEFYPDDIMKLDGDYLRQFDHLIYSCADMFVQEIYESPIICK